MVSRPCVPLNTTLVAAVSLEILQYLIWYLEDTYYQRTLEIIRTVTVGDNVRVSIYRLLTVYRKIFGMSSYGEDARVHFT